MSIGLVSHVFNESLLIPHWVEHHLPLVDQMVFIDHHSNDNTVDLIKTLAPDAIILRSKIDKFDFSLTDQEVMEVEKDHLKTDWKMCLNTTEFLWCKDLPEILEREGKNFEAVGFRAYMMVDNNLNQSLDEPLWKSRTNGYLDDETSMASRRWRYIHRMEHGAYGLGRHNTGHNATRDMFWNILFAEFAPWPQAVGRKLQVQTRMTDADKAQGSGIQHLQSLETLNNFYQSELLKSSNLLLDTSFKMNYDHFIT